MPKPSPLLDPDIYAVALDDSPYFRFYDRSPVTRLLLATLPRYLRPGASVLDVGCGNAIGACHLVAAGAQHLSYVGVDSDQEICDWAQRVLAHLPAQRLRGRILTQSLQDFLAGPALTFDLIFWSWAFRSCLDVRRAETHEPIGRAIAARLAPGGTLLIGDAFIAPGATSEEIDRIHHHHGRLVGERGTGHPVFPPDLIAALFERAGLRCVERQDVPALPLGQILNIPHDRYCLQAFQHAGNAA